jgi:hypothetical protein
VGRVFNQNVERPNMFREFQSESREIFQRGHKLEVHKAQISHGLKVVSFEHCFVNQNFIVTSSFSITTSFLAPWPSVALYMLFYLLN